MATIISPGTQPAPYDEALVKRLRRMLLIVYSALERGGHLTQYQHGEVLDALAAADSAIAANTALPPPAIDPDAPSGEEG